MKIVLLPNFSKERTMTAVNDICHILSDTDSTLLALEMHRPYMAGCTSKIEWIEYKDMARCDLLAAIGGDGTLIQYARYAAMYGKPIVGVSTGTLGYMTEIDMKHLQTGVERLLAGNYKIQSRYALSASWCGGEVPFVLNDVLVCAAEPYILSDFRVFSDGNLIDIYRADSMIFATPTGSTAQTIAYGGPIIEPGMAAILIQPVGAQLGMRTPYILSNERTLTITAQQELWLICDGHKQARIMPGTEICIQKSRYAAQFISMNQQTSIYRMQEKLGELRRKIE